MPLTIKNTVEEIGTPGRAAQRALHEFAHEAVCWRTRATLEGVGGAVPVGVLHVVGIAVPSFDDETQDPKPWPRFFPCNRQLHWAGTSAGRFTDWGSGPLLGLRDDRLMASALFASPSSSNPDCSRG